MVPVICDVVFVDNTFQRDGNWAEILTFYKITVKPNRTSVKDNLARRQPFSIDLIKPIFRFPRPPKQSIGNNTGEKIVLKDFWTRNSLMNLTVPLLASWVRLRQGYAADRRLVPNSSLGVLNEGFGRELT